MSDEHDSWFKSAFDFDIGAAVPASGSISSGMRRVAEGAGDVLSAGGQALVDWEEAKIDAAHGVLLRGVSGAAGVAAEGASALGDDGVADGLRRVESEADAQAAGYQDEAARKLEDARQQVLGDDPPPTERPDPPEGGGPPTDRAPIDYPPPPPTERPDRPEGGGPPTERRPQARSDGVEPEWMPPGYPFPRPPPVPDFPPDLPPDSGPVPVPPGPEPDVPETERADHVRVEVDERPGA